MRDCNQYCRAGKLFHGKTYANAHGQRIRSVDYRCAYFKRSKHLSGAVYVVVCRHVPYVAVVYGAYDILYFADFVGVSIHILYNFTDLRKQKSSRFGLRGYCIARRNQLFNDSLLLHNLGARSRKQSADYVCIPLPHFRLQNVSDGYGVSVRACQRKKPASHCKN